MQILIEGNLGLSPLVVESLTRPMGALKRLQSLNSGVPKASETPNSAERLAFEN